MNTPENRKNELHVVFGTGPVGLTLTDVLLAQGKRVRLINRSGRAAVPDGVELIAADATNPDTAKELCRGAAVVYHCANVPYIEQYEVIPRLQNSLIAGAGEAGAILVVTDSLYMYGETHGRPMTEDTPHAATTRKGRMRAQVAENYLQAHRSGTVQVALGRAADFFGPASSTPPWVSASSHPRWPVDRRRCLAMWICPTPSATWGMWRGVWRHWANARRRWGATGSCRSPPP